MKIKTDFVTNSSSSSFIVAFPFKVTDIEPLYKLFDPEKVKTIFDDCLKQTPLEIKNTNKCHLSIIKELSNGTPFSDKYGPIKERTYWHEKKPKKYLETQIGNVDVLPKKDEWNHPYLEILDFEDDLKVALEVSKTSEQFVKRNEGKFLYFFEYGDEDGAFFSEMEHGGTFNKLEHIQISKH